ncbi:endonuclease/exonuclease/phosphatase [Actinomadura craniellae]|uniref:Endonuclease/exonuclease/phosphatase n=1 Tax=Actinomadura craniellae TaxID=2231787 RepID=A0A365HBK0_9ACTN|nr:endonuclease/exonuclease/phosphatase family protein [Actinomadura craniellae]RAY16461.1 endonuclease/exonuclease/phosphatase [Actinomadura craniellae]
MATTDVGTQAGGSAEEAGPTIVPQGPARLTLIAVTTVVLAQTLRFSLPLFDRFAESSGVAAAAAVVLLVYLAGLLAPAVRRAAGPKGLIVAGVGGLLAVRLLAQVLSPQLWLACLGTALAMIAIAALYESARGLSGVGFATAVVAGLAVDTAVRMTFATWDPVWRSGIGPWLVCLALVGLGAAALVRELSTGLVPPPGISWRDALGAAALGPFLALQALVFANPAFVASSGWRSLTAAGAAVLIGQALALAFLASGVAVRAVPGGVAVLGGTVLGVLTGTVAGTYALTGWPVPVIAVLGQVLSAWLLAVACRAPLRRAGRGGPVWRIDVGAALGGFLIALVLVAYQLGTVETIPLPNNVLPGLAGIGLGALAAIAAARGGPLPARAPLRALIGGAVPLVLLLAIGVFSLTVPEHAPAPQNPEALRVVTYNIHEAVGRDGKLDPAATAAAIEAERPNVVLLQEVSRGSLTSGTTDLAVWLSRRLGMRLVWGPAADGQFGNAILTSYPVRSSGGARMPRGDWSQIRGYVWARLAVGNRTVDVWSTHLEDGADQADARAREITALLKAWGDAPRTIIAGDLNAGPGSPELGLLTDGTGLRSAAISADAAPTTASGEKYDWVLGTDDLLFSDHSVRPSPASDHHPVAVTVRFGQ